MNNNDDYALLTDLYQITMAQGYWACGKLEEEGCFHIFFREPPFKGGYAVASGMDLSLKWWRTSRSPTKA